MFFAIIRPLTSLRLGDCEVLLETISDPKKKADIKQLPSVACDQFPECTTKSKIIDHISQKTSVKVKKVILVKLLQFYNQFCGSHCNLSFCVVPLTTRNDNLFCDVKMKFFLLSTLNQGILKDLGCTSETMLVLQGLDSWIKKQSMRPFGLLGLFRASGLDRIHENITNPAYATEPNRKMKKESAPGKLFYFISIYLSFDSLENGRGVYAFSKRLPRPASGDAERFSLNCENHCKIHIVDWLLLENSLSPDEAMRKMKEANKVDLFISNPLFRTDLNPYSKVDFLVVNNFFGQDPPDYSQISIPNREEWFKGQTSAEENRELSWVEEFPAHRAAADGDVAGLRHFIENDVRVVDMWDHDGWAPAHYACWYGRAEALELLLVQGGCDPNIRNKNSTSLLHLAAGCGHAPIVKLLTEHPFIDRHALDRQHRSAMACCEQIRSKDWNKCMSLLKDLNHRIYPKLVVHRMDGTDQAVELRNGSSSKVSDVMSNLHFSFEARRYFALWITSKSLHLQLKPDHSPLVETEKWPEILQQLGGVQPAACRDERPSFVLKRDVRLLPNVEEEVSDLSSIHLLYEEARSQVLRGLYPCSEQVAVAMAGVVLRIIYGPFDPKKHKVGFFSEEVMRQLLPTCKLRLRAVHWPTKTMNEYREISEKGPGEISQLQLLYLRYCWTQIPLYGSAFFTGFAYATKRDGGERYQRIVPLYIGINHRGVHFIKVENKALLVSVSYHALKWTVDDEKKFFQIKDEKINMIIHTPQALLVCSLMDKLSQATSPLSH